jgi:Trypsin/PAN domain
MKVEASRIYYAPDIRLRPMDQPPIGYCLHPACELMRLSFMLPIQVHSHPISIRCVRPVPSLWIRQSCSIDSSCSNIPHPPEHETSNNVTTRTNFKAAILLLLVFVFNGHRAEAAMGEVDVENEFPYVVRVDLGNGSCSGVVTSDNLVTTAAHCIWDAEEKTMRQPNELKIRYTDISGAAKSVRVRKVFITPGYERFASWRQITWSSNFERAQQDVAILIPDEVIEVDGYAHWITELLLPPFSDFIDQVDCRGLDGRCDKPTDAQTVQLVDIVKKELGPLNAVRSLVVGYGGFACEKYTIDKDGNDDCRRDGRRRYAEAPLLETVEAGGATSGVPRIWCGGTNQDGVNPVRRGDSGGPMFVRAKDGRWLFVGYLAIGGAWGCASSIFYNLSLWKTALNSDAYKSMPAGRSPEWYQKQTERALNEMFEAFGANGDEALAHLRTLYQLHINDRGQIDSDGGLRDRDELHKMLYEQKRNLIGLWPNRVFTLEKDTVQIKNLIYRPGHDDPGAFYQASGIAHWVFSNPTTGASTSGRSKFNFVFATAGIELSQISGGEYIPKVFEEEIDGLSIKFLNGSAAVGAPAFEISSDQSLEGGDYWDKRGLSLDQCEHACQSDKQCQAFSYVERLHWCWIKSSIPGLVDKPGVVSGVKSSPEKYAFKDYSDESLEGGDYANNRGASLDQCRSICYNDRKCLSYSYIERLQWCWLKSRVPDLVYKAGIASGVKQ